MSAAIAAFVGSVWGYQYIASTHWGGRQLRDYLFGAEYMGLNEEMTGVLVIVLIRFVLGFGFTWLPLKLVGTLSARIGSRGETTSYSENESE